MEKEPHNLNREAGKLEQENAPIKKVLKISEMALSVEGQHIGEVGNLSYGEKKDMFEYDAESGELLISGQRGTALLAKDDLVRIPHALGHVTIERLLGKKSGRYSDREFERKLYEARDNTENKIDKIVFLGQLFGIKWGGHDTDFCINRAAAHNSQFSPEELTEAILDELKNEFERQHQENDDKKKELLQIIEDLKKTGVLDVDQGKNREGIVDYFYLHCRLKGIDISSSDSIYNNGFNNFLFLDELMKEYERRPDSRFGDALLAACSRQKYEWAREQNSVENRP